MSNIKRQLQPVYLQPSNLLSDLGISAGSFPGQLIDVGRQELLIRPFGVLFVMGDLITGSASINFRDLFCAIEQVQAACDCRYNVQCNKHAKVDRIQ